MKKAPTKRIIQRYPWPRSAEDGTPLGINVAEKRQDIVKIVYKYFRVPGVTMDELLQEVFLAILHKNHGNSAHDPRKSSFGHYVHLIADRVCCNIVNKRKRLERERESLDARSDDDDRSLLEDHNESLNCTVESDFYENLEDIETKLRIDGQWELARYVRAARSGSKSDVIREAMTWGPRKVTTKYIRDLRSRMMEVVSQYI